MSRSSSISSTSSAGLDPEIAPTPTPTPARPAQTRRISSAGDARELWRRMLEVQRRYGCYRSARMQAAVSAEGAADLMPSRACLDLLNDDVAGELPDEAWGILGGFVIEGEEPGGRVLWGV